MPKITLIFLITILSFTLFQSCNEEELNINNLSEFEEFLQDEVDLQNIPAMSVLIFKEGQALYENYLGESDLEQARSLEKDHLFLLASVSKVITATALLQLEEAGQLALDDPINDYLPFQVAVPNQNTKITFRMLLTHTSGIADGDALDDQYYYEGDSPTALDDFLEDYLVPGGQFYDASQNYHDFTPGTTHEYSNIGNALIAVLVEQISKQDFNTYCKANIFEPLGMRHTFWSLEEALQSNIPLVRPYNYERGDFEAVRHYTFTDYPNGGLRSTGEDLFKFLKNFVVDNPSSSFNLLSASTIQAMLTPQIPSINPEVGLHLFVMNADNNLWGHDGGEEGVATIMAFNPSTKVGAIILSNQGDADLDEILVEAYKLGLKL